MIRTYVQILPRVTMPRAPRGLLLGAFLVLAAVPAESVAQRRIGMIPVGSSELRDSVALFTTDRGALGRRWTVEYSPARSARFTAFYTDWQKRLAKVDFNKLSQEGKIDYVLLESRLKTELAQLRRIGGRLLLEVEEDVVGLALDVADGPVGSGGGGVGGDPDDLAQLGVGRHQWGEHTVGRHRGPGGAERVGVGGGGNGGRIRRQWRVDG